MLATLARRVAYTIPILLGVSFVCFALVHIAPGDPLVSVLPPDASADLQAMLTALYGFDRSYPEQFAKWLWRALHGDLGTSIATGRPVTAEVMRAVANTLRLAVLATLIGFSFGCLFGFVAGYHRGTFVDKFASALSVLGVSVPHYWLGMVLVIVFAAELGWLPPTGAGPGHTQQRVRAHAGAGVEIVLELADVAAVEAAAARVERSRWPLVEPLTDRPWGLRDFRVADPDGYYLRVTHGEAAAWG